jgi:hypothetical protein
MAAPMPTSPMPTSPMPTSPMLTSPVTSPPQYPGGPPNIPPLAEPDLSHGPKVQFYNKLKINWKFGLNNYIAVQRPNSDNDPAFYRFATPGDATRQMFHNIVFGATQGLSRNIYKLYNVTLVFKNMSHGQALDYCSRHKTSRDMIALLSGSLYAFRYHSAESVIGRRLKVVNWSLNWITGMNGLSMFCLGCVVG